MSAGKSTSDRAAGGAMLLLNDDCSDIISVGIHDSDVDSLGDTETFLQDHYNESVSSWKTDVDEEQSYSPTLYSTASTSEPPWKNMSTDDLIQREITISKVGGSQLGRNSSPLREKKLPQNLQDALNYSFDFIQIKIGLRRYGEAMKESDFVIDQLLQVLDSSKFSNYKDLVRIWLKKAFAFTMDCCLELKDMAKAERTALLFNREFKDTPHSFTSLAYIQRKRNEFREAIDTCSEGLHLFPSSQLIYTIRAKCQFSLGNFLLAKKDFLRAIDIYHWHNSDDIFEESLKPWLEKLERLRRTQKKV